MQGSLLFDIFEVKLNVFLREEILGDCFTAIESSPMKRGTFSTIGLIDIRDFTRVNESFNFVALACKMEHS
jgi:hypothetical protein